MSVTKELAAYIVESRMEDIPSAVLHQARRSILNSVGCAVGGSKEPAVETALSALKPFFGQPTAGLLARPERMDPLHAALINGTSTHVFEYDDTLPKNYIHPSPPLVAALFAYASANPVSGRDLVHAFLIGFETTSRIGNAVYPAHYDAGWHITATAGTFGAAAAIGKLLKLNTQQMVWALGLAATQAAGIREMFGYMAKSFHAGRAAQNGYASAVLAQSNFTAGEKSLEAPRGFAAVTAAKYDLDKVTTGLGKHYEIMDNAYKPYPCGLVVHPTIDGCIDIFRNEKPTVDSIAAVRVRVAPLVLDLCNKRDITRGLEGKYSIYHAAALGLVRGKAGVREFTDEAVNDPAVKRIRERVSATADSSVTEDQSRIEVELTNGQKITRFIEESLGNIRKPLSDKDIEDKLIDQSVPTISEVQARKLIELCWNVDKLDDAAAIVQATAPQ